MELSMLLGKHVLSFNPDGSFTLPQACRKELPASAYLTQGFDRNLVLLPAKTFEKTCSQLNSVSITDPLARLLSRLLLGNAVQVEISPSGKVTIPLSLQKFAGLETEITLVGQGEYLEIWSTSSWEEQATILQDFSQNHQRFEKYHISVAG